MDKTECTCRVIPAERAALIEADLQEGPTIVYCPLHAAAPELLEALEVLLSYDGISARDRARAVIAKAKGESRG